MVFINAFNNSRDLSEFEDSFEYDGEKTNIDYFLEDVINGKTSWSVPKNAQPGDIAVFFCSKSAYRNLSMAASHMPDSYGADFRDFIDRQKALYKKYSGFLLGCGVVKAVTEYDEEINRWFADIDELHQFPNPVSMDDFKSFIKISSYSSVTYLNEEQWERLKWIINRNNPGSFQNVTAPFDNDLNQELEKAIQEESKKTLDQLKKEAQKKASEPVAASAQTKVFVRNPTIAAYVKKRADGFCQLCGMKAPFTDKHGDPYLECHHITWLSAGGMDSIENCVALCPNCHRKMHILNDESDINKLKETNL